MLEPAGHTSPSKIDLSFLKRTVAAQIHAFGFLAAVVGLIGLLLSSTTLSPVHSVWGSLLFGITGIFVFGVSAVYHFLSDGVGISERLERRFEKLDHIAIFLFIAGTYSPVLLVAVPSAWGNILLGLVWGFALFGVVYTLYQERLPRWIGHRYTQTFLFVGMGWLLLIRVGEILAHLSVAEKSFLFLGAAAYTVGAFVYALKWPNPVRELFGHHEIWHLLVLAGFVFHYLMIFKLTV